MSSLINFLKSIGLSEKEAIVYLAGVKAGPILAARISKKTGFSRQHTYDLLKSLEQKGFLSKMGKNYGQRFVMEEPRNLKNILERKKAKIERLEKKLDFILPEIESIVSQKINVPKIKFFEEVEGIRELFEDMLDCRSKKHYYIGSIKEMALSVGEEYFKTVVERRIKNGISSKAIRTHTHELEEPLYNKEEYDREVRYAPEDIKYLQTIVIYDNKVVVVSSQKESFGFIIESKEFQSTMKTLFDSLWEKASVK
jgi:HTH-type transcriptional regulator, sugar sensing transcriptional regulator